MLPSKWHLLLYYSPMSNRRDRSPARELLKIGQLARRAGVARGTIQHYVREGLLPRPVKTHRNMALYDAACVDRIRLIKDLQRQRFLPLSVIRRLVAGKGSGAQAKAALEVQQAALGTLGAPDQAASIGAEDAARAFGLPRALVAKLERLGFVSARREKDGPKLFSGPDVEVLAAIGHLKRLGITERAGFRPNDLLMYRKALEGLLALEVETFLRVVIGKKGPDEAAKLARAGIDGATSLLVALRKKLINDMLLRTARTDALDPLLGRSHAA